MKYSKEWLSEKEIKTIFRHPAINSRDILLMKVCYFGALRIGEALNSKKDDYRNENDKYYYLLIREQKTDKNNWEKQPIPSILYGDIIRFCNDYDLHSEDYLFQSNRDKKLSYNMAYKTIKKSVKKAGIKKDITTHSFRRSRATHLFDLGWNIYRVSRLLRHKSIDTTRVYLKLAKRKLYNDLEKADRKALYNDNEFEDN